MKKILAIILSVMLIMSMGAVAFASEVLSTPNYHDSGTVTINKSYKLIGNGTSPAEDFELTQKSSAVVDGIAAEAPALVSISKAVFAEGEATEDGTKHSFTVTLPTYTNVGIYEYVLTEVAGTTAGVTYYAEDIKLIVTVVNDDSGQVRVSAVHTEAPGEDGTYHTTTKSDTFTNTYSAGKLNITKTVKGVLGDKTKYFQFKVTLTGEEGKTYQDSFPVISSTSYSNDGTTNPTTVSMGENIFYLKDGETFTIGNLPYGVSYVVEEVDADEDGYETGREGEDAAINASTQTVAFTNVKGGTPDTGVFVDSLPYVIIIAFVVFGGVLMVIKRRKVEA